VILCISFIGLVILFFLFFFVILTMDTLSEINLMDGWMDMSVFSVMCCVLTTR